MGRWAFGRSTPRSDDKDSARRRFRRRLTYTGMMMVPLTVLLGGPAEAAGQCVVRSGTDPVFKGSQTKRVVTSRAGNTWDDWIWRGQIFQCSWNVPSCSYAYATSTTKSWQWSIGGQILGGYTPSNWQALMALLPTYGRSGSTSSTYTFTVNLRPGQYAQPIMVVRRRWEAAVFVGGYPNYGACLFRPGVPGRFVEQVFQPNIRYGSHAVNNREMDFATYNVWG